MNGVRCSSAALFSPRRLRLRWRWWAAGARPQPQEEEAAARFNRTQQLQINKCHEPLSTRTHTKLPRREFQWHRARGCPPDGGLERPTLRSRDLRQRICTCASPDFASDNRFDRDLHRRNQRSLSLQQLGVLPCGARRVSRRGWVVEQRCGDDCRIGTVFRVEERRRCCSERGNDCGRRLGNGSLPLDGSADWSDSNQ